MTLDLNLPADGESPWGEKLRAAIDKLNEEGWLPTNLGLTETNLVAVSGGGGASWVAILVSTSADNSSVVKRTGSGRVRTQDPSSAFDAVNLQYFNDIIDALTVRVANLENGP